MPFLDQDETAQLTKDVTVQLLEILQEQSTELSAEPDTNSDACQSSITVASGQDQQEEPPAKKAKTGLGRILNSMYKNATAKPQNKKSIQEQAEMEIKQYMEAESIDVDSKPLVWWKQHEGRFPRLALLAKMMLCIPATSTPSERLFSTAGDIITAKRAR